MPARAPIAVLVLLALAARADALSIKPPGPWAAASPNGEYVYVSRPESLAATDPDRDAAVIRARCTRSGLYRRGEWDEPVWALDGYGERGWVSDDGIHLVILRYQWGPASPQGGYSCAAVYSFFANGKPIYSAEGRSEFIWCHPASGGFSPDGLFHVKSTRGDEAIFDPCTLELVGGRDAEYKPEEPAKAETGWRVPSGLEVSGWCAVGAVVALLVARRNGRRPRS